MYQMKILFMTADNSGITGPKHILNRFQSKFILCKIDNLSTKAEVLLVIPT